MFLTYFHTQKYTGGIISWVGIFLTVTLVSLKERLVYTVNKLFVKQVKIFHLLLDLDPFILQCSLHNICDILFNHYDNHIRMCMQTYLYNYIDR